MSDDDLAPLIRDYFESGAAKEDEMYQIACFDPIIHTEASPVCSDASCPCHEQFIVTYKDNPHALPFVSEHWIVSAETAIAAIEQVAGTFWYNDKEAVKSWLMAYPVEK